MVEVPEELQVENADSREMTAMKALVSRLEAQIEAQQEQLGVFASQLASKDRQIEQLHVLLQQAQAALPAPRDGRPWWKRWGRR
jgi:hypothetical protein